MTLVLAAVRAGVMVASASTIAVISVGVTTERNVQSGRTLSGNFKFDNNKGVMA